MAPGIARCIEACGSPKRCWSHAAPAASNVEPLEPTPSDKPKATIRDQLEAHATHATCFVSSEDRSAGICIRQLRRYGRWRTYERVAGGLGNDPPVVARGIFRMVAYENPEFKQLLAGDPDRFAEAFVDQLATFALRRVMTIDDRPQIKAIAEASRHDGYRLR